MSHPIILPDQKRCCVVSRWQQAIEHDDLQEWRSFGFMLSAEADYQRRANGAEEMAENLLTLSLLALQHCFDMYPMEKAA